MRVKFILILVTFLLIHNLFAIAAARSSAGFIADAAATKNQFVKSLQNSNGEFDFFGGALSSRTTSALFSVANVNCSNSNYVFAPDAVTCNGASVTSVNFSNASRTVVSGTDNTVGVVYRYSSVGIAPDNTTLDALVTVISYSNNQDSTPNTFRNADLPSPPTGFDGNLQPSLEQETDTFISNTPWSGNITYRIQFVIAGTSTPKVISVAATTIDNDGSNACGGLRESVTFSSGRNQILINTPANTTQTISVNTVTGPAVVQSGIGVGNNYANAALFLNVSQFDWTYSFATTGNCTSGGASEDRFGSLNLSCQITFDRTFTSVPLSGTVFNDTNGLTDSIVNGSGNGTPSGVQLYANLVDANNYVVSSVAVAANGTYSFPTAFAGNYTVQISTNQGIESSTAPAVALPTGWVATGEYLGTGAGNDGSVNSSLSVTVAAAAVTDANFAIEQRPTVNNNTATSRANPGGTISSPVAATTFSGSDTSPGTVSFIRITAFPGNATSFAAGTTTYYPNAGSIPGVCPTTTCAAFPGGGLQLATNSSGNPTAAIQVDPVNGAVSVTFQYVTIDNAGIASATTATASVPFAIPPTAANGSISGALHLGGNPIKNTLVVLIDAGSGSRTFTRTEANGNYLFNEKEVGKTYIVQPLSSKYSFSPATSILNLLDNASGLNFNSAAKTYRPKNDFDGDGKSDVAVFRPSEGNWYVLKSSDGQLNTFAFGGADIPVSADFDGDGKTDFAVFRPSEGMWYIWQSATQRLRAEQFGSAEDKLVPADYDGDGKADVAVYRNGVWYILRSSSGSFETRNYGAETDTPAVGDYDGDARADFSVYRPAEGIWHVLNSSNGESASQKFGLSTDVPVNGDFDGDGFADIAQFRNGFWYILNSTTAFEARQFGAGEDESIVGDYDGDGRSDTAIFRNGIWSIRDSGSGAVRDVYLGLPTDVPVK